MSRDVFARPANQPGGSLARRARGADRLVVPMLFLSLAMLALGVTLPIMEIEPFFGYSDGYSILNAVIHLFEEGEIVLAFIVAVFAVAVPIAKLGIAVVLWRGPAIDSHRFDRTARWLEIIGRWAMLDVFIVAMLVYSVKAGTVSDASAAPGLYLFIGSIVLSMLAVHRIRSKSE